MQKKLNGVIAPVVTNFLADSGELDVAGFSANLRAHLAAGLNGILVGGSTGEAALLDVAERGMLVDAARDVIPADKWLLVGTGAESTRTCLQLTRDAAQRGADAVLVVAPHYYGSAMTDVALRDHYRRVADESPIPVMLYTIPKYMHFALSAPLVAELAQHENIIGMKDSSGNRELFAGYMPSHSPTFSVLTGNAQMFNHALSSGSPGGILAASLFAPALALEIYESAVAGDRASAEAAQTRFSPLGAKIVGEMGIPGVKVAMERVGLVGGVVRPPLQPIAAGVGASIDELLRSAELATA
ncbi:MAG TPA: dihydrodipicolinate synthase family protein [Gemmatimonadaceae bacterium]|jgi:4-hydroxy-2-oxoglutarate aldolase